MWRDHLTEIIVFTVLFLLVSAHGLRGRPVAARRQDMAHLDEWGLGGRSFGGWITWFLVGGDLYTAYTFVAVPALMFGAGAAGLLRRAVHRSSSTRWCSWCWSGSGRCRTGTASSPRPTSSATRFGSPTLALLVAITGIVATMPYIALQLVGIEAVLKTMGVTGESALARHLPIIIAFAILAAYTYQSGLRAPALIAFVKDTLIYIVILVAVIYLPYKLGGWGDDLRRRRREVRGLARRPDDGILLNANNQLQYITLALGSALALFLYPHSITGVLASRNRDVIKRNMSALPAYSLLLGLIALLGYMAIAAGVKPLPGATAGQRGQQHRRAAAVRPAVPGLVRRRRVRRHRHRRAGAGGDHVDRRGEPVHPQHLQGVPASGTPPRPRRPSVCKITSLVVKVGAVACIVFLDPQFSIDLQLIGGVIILQTLPAVALGLYTRWFHRGGADRRLGRRHGRWACGCSTRSRTRRPAGRTSAARRSRWRSSASTPRRRSTSASWRCAVNLVVAALVTLVLRAAKVADGVDGTEPDDYFADEDSPRRGTDSEGEPVAVA